MDARAMMKRLREEKAARANAAAATSTSDPTAAPAPPAAPSRAAPTPVPPSAPPVAPPPPPSPLWEKEALYERSVVVDGGAGPGRGKTIRLLEDPTGMLAGGNGATVIVF